MNDVIETKAAPVVRAAAKQNLSEAIEGSAGNPAKKFEACGCSTTTTAATVGCGH